MPGPQSTLFFLMMAAAFAGLIWWLAVARQLVFRVFAACLAFVPAMLFGVAAVNKYYDYYQTWGALYSDLSGQTTSIPHLTAASVGKGTGGSLKTLIAGSGDAQIDAEYGVIFSTTITGRRSHISRQVLVYLPPQYFSKTYANYRFPVIELLHGSPGDPSAWVNVMNVVPIYLNAMASGKARPAVLSQILRVQPPGPAWGIAGYSEGGFCAANLGLRYGRYFGYAGVLSGYFRPLDNQLGHPPRPVSPFGGNARLRRQNTPDDLVRSLPAGAPVAQFWLGAGAGVAQDVGDARVFDQLLQIRQPRVTLRLVPGGGHSMFTWRSLAPPMLEWMTPRLTAEADLATKRATRARKAQARAARAWTRPRGPSAARA